MSEYTKITNPERISRILMRVCESTLQLIIRPNAESHLGIRGIAQYLYLNSDPSKIFITKISSKGIEILKDLKTIQIEFSMMSTKVVFNSEIYAFSGNSMYCAVPTQLMSIERRKNARYPTNLENSPYVYLDSLKESPKKALTMPTYSRFDFLTYRFKVSDISMGGVCISSDFPVFPHPLDSVKLDLSASLILPMQGDYLLPVEIRWSKKIKEHIEGPTRDKKLVTYKLGLQFVESYITQERKEKILQYLNVLDTSQTI